MLDDSALADPLAADEAGPRLGREPLLDQREIDALAGFSAPIAPNEGSGPRAVAGAGAREREPLPMLRVALDELARRLSVRLRALLGNEVEVAGEGSELRRFGEFVDELTLPCLAVTFRADGWDGQGLVAIGPAFAILVVDALLGAGRRTLATGIGARPFSTIENALLTRLADLVLSEGEAAFAGVAPAAFRRRRVDSDPRIGAVAADTEAAHVASFRLILAGRSAPFHLVLPAATLEPVRSALGLSYRGEGGRDDRWSSHLATAAWRAEVEAEAVLHETALPLGRVLGLAVGDTLTFDMRPTDPVEIRCGGRVVTRGRIGQAAGRIAVQITEPVARPSRAIGDVG